MNLRNLFNSMFKVGADAVEDVGSVLAGEGIYHSFFGKSFHKYAEKKEKANPRHAFSDFCNQYLSQEERALLNEIYQWWYAPKTPQRPGDEPGLGRKENDFVVLMMGYADHHTADNLKLLVRIWASGDRKAVELELYKLEHDWLDQDIRHDIVDPILTPLNKKIQDDLERKRNKRRMQMAPRPGRRYF